MWMCEYCYPEAEEIGIIAPGFSLVLDGGKYHVLGGQGHKGHFILTFDTAPWPDPDPECLESTPEIAELGDRWMDEATDLNDKMLMHASTAYAFLSACKNEGWEKGCFTFWLFDRCGRMIQERGSS